MVLNRLGLAAAIVALLAPALPADAARPHRRAIHRKAARPARPPLASPAAEIALRRLLADDADREDELHPLDVVARGEAVPAWALAQVFTPALDNRQRESAAASLKALARIDRARLTPARQVSYDAFAATKRAELALLDPQVLALTRPQPFTHFQGIHASFPRLMGGDGTVRFATLADYRRAFAIDAAFPAVLDNAVARFREGLALGVTEPKPTVTEMIGQVDALLALGDRRSPFCEPTRKFPAAIPRGQRRPLARECAAIVRTRINPAYRQLRAFLADEYLPAARASVGLSALPGGAELYRVLVADQTTLPLDPAQVHALGLAEVARIQGEMEAVKAELGSTAPLRDFFEAIRSDPRFHPKSAKQMADGFAAIARAVDAEVPRLFTTVPRTPLEIRPYPPERARFEVGGSYEPGSADGSRPGIFRYNTFDVEHRFLSGMTTLYLHEGKPGHHFQISLAAEDESLPDFQRFGGNNAFVEGWALYAETLGYDMGLYKDPLQHWGTLDDEMLRAMRLVVDTGIHTMNWNREQAIDYMLANSGIGRTDATAEVDRYIANPAQALSYKLGALTILRLRDKARAALGAKFDLPAFHAAVLDAGALPLPVLEAKIDRWIAARK